MKRWTHMFSLAFVPWKVCFEGLLSPHLSIACRKQKRPHLKQYRDQSWEVYGSEFMYFIVMSFGVKFFVGCQTYLFCNQSFCSMSAVFIICIILLCKFAQSFLFSFCLGIMEVVLSFYFLGFLGIMEFSLWLYFCIHYEIT